MDALAILQRLGTGQLIDELSDALTKTAEEVVATGKAGTVTLTLKISTHAQGNPLVTIDETIARRSPKEDPKGAMFWALDGALHQQDPRQLTLDFRTVDTTTGEIRNVQTRIEERSAT